VIHVWPDVAAATSPALKVRDQLDYLVWIAATVEPLGFHGGPDLETWRGRVQRAYAALVDSMAPGHGDPLPPDVPPAVQPGTWPDVAAASIPGMTIRHQLSVIGSIAAHTLADRGFPRTAAETATWTQRVQTAYDALDHGPSMSVPESARTQPPPPPPSPTKGKRRPGAGSQGAGSHGAGSHGAGSHGAGRGAARPAAARSGGAVSKKAARKPVGRKPVVPKKAAPKRGGATPAAKATKKGATRKR
jgi:hypothetical protein